MRTRLGTLPLKTLVCPSRLWPCPRNTPLTTRPTLDSYPPSAFQLPHGMFIVGYGNRNLCEVCECPAQSSILYVCGCKREWSFCAIHFDHFRRPFVRETVTPQRADKGKGRQDSDSEYYCFRSTPILSDMSFVM